MAVANFSITKARNDESTKGFREVGSLRGLRNLVFALVVFAGASGTADGQTLDAVRDAVRTDPHAGETREERRNRERAAGDCYEEGDDSSWVRFLFDLMFSPLCGMVLEPAEVTLERDYCGRTYFARWYWLPQWDGCFARYPYADGYERFTISEDRAPVSSKLWSGRLAVDYGDDFDRIDRWGGRFLWETRLGVGLDGEMNFYRERMLGSDDTLALGDLNVLYRVFETERTQWRIGIGMNWLADHDTDLGLNFTLRSDWQPCWPLVLAGEVDWGTLGHATTFHGHVSAGVMVRQCEVFVGYDYRTVDSVELEGPLVGLRWWF
jgi:hypothetical protein